MFVKFNCFFQVPILLASLGYGMEVMGFHLPQEREIFLIFEKFRLAHLTCSLCIEGSCFGSEASMA
jgi:hypothetical protein